MKIERIETFILHVPVTRGMIKDSTYSVTHRSVPGLIVHTDDGVIGYGFTGTQGHLESDRLIVGAIENCYGPLLIGCDPTEVRQIWRNLYHHPPLQYVGRGGIMHLAQAAIDIALWDVKAKAAGMPLWKLLGGAADKQVAIYNTDAGWLNWPIDQMIDDALAGIAENGFIGVKVKFGSPDPMTDVERITAVRKALDPHTLLMIDGNGKWDFPTAMRFCSRIQDLDITWIEEPLWFDDREGHARLARAQGIPIALGEQLYLTDHFRDFIAAGAVHYVQPDAVRLAGITEWWRVAELAHANRLPVCAHTGDMMQVHAHLAIAHPAVDMLENLPWMRNCFVDPVTVVDGILVKPELPGAGTTLMDDALKKFDVSKGAAG